MKDAAELYQELFNAVTVATAILQKAQIEGVGEFLHTTNHEAEEEINRRAKQEQEEKRMSEE